MPFPTPQLPGCQLVSGMAGSAPSRSWPPSWSSPPVQPASRFGRWWPTAPTATTPASPKRLAPLARRLCWRSSPARAPGRQQSRRIARPRPLASLAGAVPTGLAGGGASSGAFVTATTDPASLPGHSSWYLLTNLPRPASRRAEQAQLSEIVALYGLRNWIEQGYKQVKSELGWADFQVRADRAIRRHWTLVCCAFSFCWHAGQTEAAPAPPASPLTATGPTAAAGQAPARGAPQRLDPDPVATGGGRGWLIPSVWLRRCWRGWSTSVPPPALRLALDWVQAGRPIYLYLPP